jgi:hypothetical protein
LLKPYPRNPLRGAILAAQILIAATVPMILLAVFQLKEENLGFIALTSGVLLAAFILLLWGNGQGEAYEQEIGQLEAGQHLARWECTTTEYRSFLKGELARLRSEFNLFICLSFGFAAAAVIFFAFIFPLPAAWAMGGIFLGAGLLVSLISYLQFLKVKARHETDDLEAGEILFGPNGVLMFGRFIPLRGFNLRLEKVAYIAQGPSRLHFVSTYRRRHGRRVRREVYIPVPSKHRAEAKGLAAKYKVTGAPQLAAEG